MITVYLNSLPFQHKIPGSAVSEVHAKTSTNKARIPNQKSAHNHVALSSSLKYTSHNLA